MRQHEFPYSRISGVPNVKATRLQQMVSVLGTLFTFNSPQGRIVNPRLSQDSNPGDVFPNANNLPTINRPINQKW